MSTTMNKGLMRRKLIMTAYEKVGREWVSPDELMDAHKPLFNTMLSPRALSVYLTKNGWVSNDEMTRRYRVGTSTRCVRFMKPSDEFIYSVNNITYGRPRKNGRE